jgi:hypothetical protein
MQYAERGKARQRILELLLGALVEAKNLKPGAVNRRVLSALAQISWLTPDMLSAPPIAPLAQSLGLTQHVLERERQTAASESIEREKKALKDIAVLVEHAKSTPWDVVSLLLFDQRPDLSRVLVEAAEVRASHIARKGAAVRHAEDNKKREAIRAIWATGNFATRALCAEQEGAALGMSPDTARKALRGAPDPFPWPAKTNKSRPRS